MIKTDELSNPKSCLNKARSDERIFVLLERDIATPATIRFWVKERIRKKKNKPDDEQIREALRLADQIQFGA